VDWYKGLGSTDWAAWWGAIVATIVLLWDVIKWKLSGARICMEARPNYIFIGDPARAMEHYIYVNITNKGTLPVTIQTVGYEFYNSIWNRFLKKVNKAGVAPSPFISQPLPFKLDPGSYWIGMLLQNQEIEEMLKSGFFIFGSRKQVMRNIEEKGFF
jgi:hypothetical protein